MKYIGQCMNEINYNVCIRTGMHDLVKETRQNSGSNYVGNIST